MHTLDTGSACTYLIMFPLLHKKKTIDNSHWTFGRVSLCFAQVANFYNTIDQQMLKCQQAMMLEAALAFEDLVKHPSKVAGMAARTHQSKKDERKVRMKETLLVQILGEVWNLHSLSYARWYSWYVPVYVCVSRLLSKLPEEIRLC